jgi:hypothetical protein
MAWRRNTDPFPAPLREFRESEWPPVEGECLGHYGCWGRGYGVDCVPRPGEFCGQLHYESLARDFPDRPGMLAAAKRGDAFTRYHQARLSWLGEDHPGWLAEFFDGDRYHEIRYGGA